MSVQQRDDPPTDDEIAAGDFIPLREVGRRLGLDRSTVHKMLDRGALRYVRATGDGKQKCARRVSVVSLDYFIRQNVVTQ